MKIFLPYVQGQLQHASRVDVVWDQYRESSLKSQTREKRGKGVRRMVEGATNLQGNWQQFMRIDANNAELFTFLVVHLTYLETEKQVVTTISKDALCSFPQDFSSTMQRLTAERFCTCKMLSMWATRR